MTQSNQSESQRVLVAHLKEELQHAQKTIVDFMKQGDQGLAALLTLLVAIVLLFERSRSDVVLIIFPFLLLIPAAYSLRLNALIQHLGGYRSAIEERLNEELGVDVYHWEASVAPVLKGSFASNFLTALLGLFFVASCVNGAMRMESVGWSVGMQVVIVLGYIACAIVLAAGFWQSLGLFGASYQTSRHAFGEKVIVPSESDPELVSEQKTVAIDPGKQVEAGEL